MKALVWHGRSDVRCDTVPDPRIEDARDIIVKVTSTAICGSDLHLYDGYIPAMESGDVLGHEFMGEVVDVGSGIGKFKVGDRVVVPFNICCGECFFCKKGLWSCCERTNRDADKAIKMFGHNTAAASRWSCIHTPDGLAQHRRATVCASQRLASCNRLHGGA
jgi:threonine dehydrogenase-like Zn-dependent dehydrogenase